MKEGLSGESTSESAGGGVREQLVAELQRTVETVMAAVDAAAAKTLEAAEGEAIRRAELIYQRLEDVSDHELARMRELSRELSGRAAQLEQELNELSQLVDAARGNAAPTPMRLDPEPPGPPDLAAGLPNPLDEVERAQEELRSASRLSGPLRRRFRRSEPEADVPEGVRVIIAQMRLNGTPDTQIIERLEELGIEHAAELVAQVHD